MGYDKKIVTAIIVLNVIFAAVIVKVFLTVGSEPTVLVGAWFTFTTGELWQLSKIKRKKLKKRMEERINDTDY